MQQWRNADNAIRLDVVGLFLAGLINTFLAMLDAGVVLGAGTRTIQPDIEARIRWIAENTLVWQAGWVFWFAVTLSFSWSYFALGRNLGGTRTWIQLAIGLAIIAAAVDIVGVLVNLVMLPALAETYLANEDSLILSIFQAQEDLANALTNVAAFGLYSVAGLVILPACFATTDYPKRLAWLGLAEWGIALGATVLLLIAPSLATVPLLISFVLYAPWVWASAWWLLQREVSAL